MSKIRQLVIVVALLSLPCVAQNFSIQKFCEVGGQTVTTQGLASKTHVQRSIPSCTVTVYFTGTTTKASIFSNNLSTPTPLANPFTANVDGSFLLYVANSSCYDVVTAGGNTGDQFPAPFTYTNICSGGGGGGGSFNPGTPFEITQYNSAGTNIQDSRGSDNPANGPTQWPAGTNVINNAVYNQYTVGGIGVVANGLVQTDSSNFAISASTSSTTVIGIADATVTSGGAVPVAILGSHNVLVDNQTALNDYACPSTTQPFEASDVGATQPTGCEILGKFTSINTGAGTLAVLQYLTPLILSPGSTSTLSGGSTCPTANAFFLTAGNLLTSDCLFTDDGAGNPTAKSLGLTDTTHAGFFYLTQGATPGAAPANSTMFYVAASIPTPNSFKLPVAAGAGDVGKSWGVTSSGTDANNNPVDVMGMLPVGNKTCQTGIGDGLNAIPAGTYLQFFCVNDSSVTRTITAIHCWTDNAGSSTLNAANNAATALLTGAVTCNNTKASGGAAGTQSATTTLANGDAISFTFVADGTSKQTTWTVSMTQ